MSMTTSEERAVAKLAADILTAASITGIAQVSVLGDDAPIVLPAIVVSAHYQEIEWALKKSGIYGGRYRLDVEVRGIRTKPGTSALETILGKVSDTFNTMPGPVPTNPFSYYLIEKWEAADAQAGNETRDFTRSYTVFALFS
jgi:hypothetical protein